MSIFILNQKILSYKNSYFLYGLIIPKEFEFLCIEELQCWSIKNKLNGFNTYKPINLQNLIIKFCKEFEIPFIEDLGAVKYKYLEDLSDQARISKEKI